MLLYSFYFLIFLSVVFILFWKAPQKWQWLILLLASYYFYASFKPGYLAIIILTTVVNFYFTQKMHGGKKKLYLVLIIFTNLALLGIFKYLDFFSITLNQITGVNLPQFKLLQPLGISFYTLQITGYVIDVYKNRKVAEKHLGHFALFCCFFPQLSAGPIERSNTLLPQLKTKRKFNYLQASEGAKLFLIGLFKKLVIADNLGFIVDRGFDNLPQFKGLSLILIVFFFSWQIYMDFSGYTDMARGAAKMVGINLMENFNLPYLANSVQNFWRRWHISFSSWLRDYVYIPLGGGRKGFVRTLINILIVFTISGLWHGAAWTFILWGFLHGSAMSFERVIKKVFDGKVAIPNIIKIVYAYILVCIFWIFFRSPNLNDAFYILKNLLVGIKNVFSPNYVLATLTQLFEYNPAEIIIVFSLVTTAIVFEIVQNKASLLKLIDSQNIFIRFSIYAIILFLIFQLRNADIKNFIYIKF